MSEHICTEKSCKEVARPLSFHDTPRPSKVSDIIVREFNRKTIWKCEAGHVTRTESIYKPQPLPEHPTAPSKKRFHMKGFGGHKPQSKQVSFMRFDGFTRHADAMTNHERIQRQRAFKEKAAR